MTSQQIDCFLTVASTESYTKASEILFISQPTISRYVANLEKELDCQLLDRNTKHVSLTEAGEIYYAHFLTWQNHFQTAKKKVQDLAHNKRHQLRHGYLSHWVTTPKISTYNFYELLDSLDYNVELTFLSLKELLQRVENGKLDSAVILDHHQINTDHIIKQYLTQVHAQLTFGQNHPLFNKPDLKPEDFKDDIFWIPVENDGFFEKKFITYCEPFGFRPNIQYAENVQTIRQYILNGQGVSIFDDWGPGNFKEAFRTIELPATEDVYLIFNLNNIKKKFDEDTLQKIRKSLPFIHHPR